MSGQVLVVNLRLLNLSARYVGYDDPRGGQLTEALVQKKQRLQSTKEIVHKGIREQKSTEEKGISKK
eukprot:2634221-Amphidinium_carterae.1